MNPHDNFTKLLVRSNKKQYCVHLAETKQNYRNLFLLPKRKWSSHHFRIQNHTILYIVQVTRYTGNTHLKGLVETRPSHSASSKKIKQFCINGHWYKHTPRIIPKVQYAFKILMTHWILQFALSIAVRSVFHRCASRDIHCWKLYIHSMHTFLSAVMFQSLLKRD